jgi:hypothetical protein
MYLPPYLPNLPLRVGYLIIMPQVEYGRGGINLFLQDRAALWNNIQELYFTIFLNLILIN